MGCNLALPILIYKHFNFQSWSSPPFYEFASPALGAGYRHAPPPILKRAECYRIVSEGKVHDAILTRRKPRQSARRAGAPMLRIAPRKIDASPFPQLPPRKTRFEPVAGPVGFFPAPGSV